MTTFITKSLWYFTATAFAISLIGCTTESKVSQHGLKEGDLLFQDLNCGDLCDAIEAVTTGVNGKDFSHCAMVVKVNDTLKVVEAIGSQVQINSVEAFFKRSDDTSEVKNITVGRLKPDYRSLIKDASAFAIEQVGQPYDEIYLMDNGKWYCSEVLYESYKEASGDNSFFHLNPMTFKDPNSKDFFPAWVTYYQELNEEIPEGEPGLNPGSISRSGKIEIIEINTFQ